LGETASGRIAVLIQRIFFGFATLGKQHSGAATENRPDALQVDFA
jgi:hypothetical protein